MKNPIEKYQKSYLDMDSSISSHIATSSAVNIILGNSLLVDRARIDFGMFIRCVKDKN